jgi:hypothetical protein
MTVIINGGGADSNRMRDAAGGVHPRAEGHGAQEAEPGQPARAGPGPQDPAGAHFDRQAQAGQGHHKQLPEPGQNDPGARLQHGDGLREPVPGQRAVHLGPAGLPAEAGRGQREARPQGLLQPHAQGRGGPPPLKGGPQPGDQLAPLLQERRAGHPPPRLREGPH